MSRATRATRRIFERKRCGLALAMRTRAFCQSTSTLAERPSNALEVPASEPDGLVRSIPRLADYWEDVHISLETVLDAGNGWLALNKPPCLSLYNDPRYDVKSRLLKLLQNPRFAFLRQQTGLREDEEPTLYFPRGLDEGASGVLVVCFTKEAYEHIRNEEILETAFAVVKSVHKRGSKPRLFGSDMWKVWDVPMTNARTSRLKIPGRGTERRPARTKYRVCNVRLDYGLLQAQYHPTVKHQLRRHCALGKVPVIGDFIYANDPHPFTTRHGRPRLGLHVRRLKFFPPDRKFKVALDAKIPNEITNLFPRFDFTVFD